MDENMIQYFKARYVNIRDMTDTLESRFLAQVEEERMLMDLNEVMEEFDDAKEKYPEEYTAFKMLYGLSEMDIIWV